ncbi:MAG: hypothetical protein FWF05_04095 [Oscillospiraceae bacterium]|nr:hypothetical protein [Oscillospiraceae bacterium]
MKIKKLLPVLMVIAVMLCTTFYVSVSAAVSPTATVIPGGPTGTTRPGPTVTVVPTGPGGTTHPGGSYPSGVTPTSYQPTTAEPGGSQTLTPGSTTGGPATTKPGQTAEPDDGSKSPQTGDGGKLVVPVFLMASCMLAGAFVGMKKKAGEA